MATPCDDQNPCTTTDTCATGTCQGLPLPATACDDQNPCTNDTCNPATGCSHSPITGNPCSDNNPCTQNDTCATGTCTPGTKSACTCQTDADCPKQDDKNPCNGVLACDKAAFPWTCKTVPGSAPVCPPLDGAPCLANACNPATGNCNLVPTGGAPPCTDGNACTTGDHCEAGACLPTAATTCDDANPCTTDSCDLTAGCQHSAVAPATPCDADASVCTTGDSCVGTFCQPGPPLPCADQNPCTADTCTPLAGCQHAPEPGPCSDNSPCTTGDHCQAGACLPTGITSCDDQNPCTSDACDLALGCEHTPTTGSPCDADGSGCTVGDACVAGTCQAGPPLACADNDPCTADSCVAPGNCVHQPAALDCSDAITCTVDSCQSPGGCVHVPTEALCDDGLVCTGDWCSLQQGCLHLPIDPTCSDGNACTIGDACKQGVCVTAGATNCDDNNVCTIDSCAPAKGCVHLPVAVDPKAADMCPAGCTLVPVDGVGLCFADYPVWGVLPDTPELVDQGDGTVYDPLTKLTWMKQPVPQAGTTWQGVIDACDASTLAGATNWRLPTRFEMDSALDVLAGGGRATYMPWSGPYGKLDSTAVGSPYIEDPSMAWNAGGAFAGQYGHYPKTYTFFRANCVH